MAPQNLPADLGRLAQAMRENNIDWAIFGGVAARFYGIDRPIRDVDIIAAAGLDFIAAALPHSSAYRYGDYRARVIGKIEVWPSPLLFDVAAVRFTFSLDQEMLRRVRLLSAPSVGDQLPVLAPEDVLVIKALQQRGPAGGKHDRDDLREVLAAQTGSLDHDYLRWRAARVDGLERVTRALCEADAGS